MAGYDGFSMSNNAVGAYDQGKVPLSKMNKPWLQANEIDLSATHARWLAKNHVGADEWHHSSKMFNRTEFYSADAIKDFVQEHGNKADEFKAATSKPADAPTPATASWTEWQGNGRSAKKVAFNDVEGHVRGGWFHHAGGKKSMNGTHIRVSYPQQGNPSRGQQFQ